MCDVNALRRGVRPSGSTLLLGDSCQPSLPYVVHGAAQVTKDGMLGLGELPLASHGSLSDALKAYDMQSLPSVAAKATGRRVHQAWSLLYVAPEREE